MDANGEASPVAKQGSGLAWKAISHREGAKNRIGKD